MMAYRAEVRVRDRWVSLPAALSVPFEIGINAGFEKIRPMLDDDRDGLLVRAQYVGSGREVRVVEHDGQMPDRYWLRHPVLGRFIVFTRYTPPADQGPGSS